MPLVCSAVLLGASDGSAHASFPGRDGLIAFDDQVAGAPPHLFSVAPSGRGLRALGGLSGSAPAWSTDGRRLAFSSEAPGSIGDLMISRGDGAGARDIAASCGPGAPSPMCGGALSLPTWAPDGRRVAFVNLIGGQNCPAKDHSECGPASLGEPRSALEVVNRDGTRRHALFTHARDRSTMGRPAWSPDGRLIAFARPSVGDLGRCYGGGLWTIRPDGTHRQPLIRTCRPGLRLALASSPDWSPDGRYLAFAAQTRTAYWDCLPHRMPGPPPPPPKPQDCHRVPAPISGADPIEDQVWDIYVVDRQGRHLHRITRNQPQPISCVLVPTLCTGGRHDAQSPTWSPSGRFIAYADAGIWTVRASGGHQHLIVKDRPGASLPAWQPLPG